MQVYYSSPWIPAAWITAHGFEPRGVWSENPGPTGAVSEGLCAFAASLAEFPKTHPDAAMIFTTACDQMRRAADAAAGGHTRVFLLNLPATWQTPAVRRLYHYEIKRLGRFLVDLGGRPPADEKLESVILDWNRRLQQLHKILPHARSRQAAETLMSFFHDGIVPGIVPPAISSGTPLALVGGPLLPSQFAIFDAIESVGGRVVLNATEPGERCLLPPLAPRLNDQTPLALLTDHYFDHSVDVFHRPNSRLYKWLGTRLAERHVQGILLWIHVGCDLWRSEAASLREAFGLPVLVLDEHETRGVGQRDLGRLCAFVESMP